MNGTRDRPLLGSPPEVLTRRLYVCVLQLLANPLKRILMVRESTEETAAHGSCVGQQQQYADAAANSSFDMRKKRAPARLHRCGQAADMFLPIRGRRARRARCSHARMLSSGAQKVVRGLILSGRRAAHQGAGAKGEQQALVCKPIAFYESSFVTRNGTPRQARARIIAELEPRALAASSTAASCWPCDAPCFPHREWPLSRPKPPLPRSVPSQRLQPFLTHSPRPPLPRPPPGGADAEQPRLCAHLPRRPGPRQRRPRAGGA